MSNLKVDGLSIHSCPPRSCQEPYIGTFDANDNIISYYNWTGAPGMIQFLSVKCSAREALTYPEGSLAGAVPNAGNGEPKAANGMVGTHHRPSDDLSVYGRLIT